MSAGNAGGRVRADVRVRSDDGAVADLGTNVIASNGNLRNPLSGEDPLQLEHAFARIQTQPLGWIARGQAGQFGQTYAATVDGLREQRGQKRLHAAQATPR